MHYTEREKKFIKEHTNLMKEEVKKSLLTMQNSVDKTIRTQVEQLTDTAIIAAHLSISSATTRMHDKVQELRKDVFMQLEPFVREQMIQAFDEAKAFHGKGATTKQRVSCQRNRAPCLVTCKIAKNSLYGFVQRKAKTIFTDGAKRIMEDLNKAIDECGPVIQRDLQDIAKQVQRIFRLREQKSEFESIRQTEDSLSVMWKNDDPEGLKTKLYRMAHGVMHTNLVTLNNFITKREDE